MVKIKYTKEKFKKINKETKAVIDDYISECRGKALTQRTILEYRNLLRHVAMLILENYENKSILEMSRRDWRSMSIMFQDELALSNSRINSILSAVTSCLDYIEDEEEEWKHYNKNPMRRLKRMPKKLVREKKWLNRSEVRTILTKLLEKGQLQCAVMVGLAYDSGARISELDQVTKNNILSGNVTNKIIRKGQKKETTLMFHNDTKELIRMWLEQRGEDDVEKLFIYPMIVNKSNKDLKRAITIKSLSSRIKSAGKLIEKDISPHVLRRSRAEGLKKGEDERLNFRKFSQKEIQIILGHSDLATTEQYLKDDSVEIMEKIIEMVAA
ncbi:hypothetical protein PM10SUCC1_32730 [Propionigenium maris DSM 9537]|uniref:Site-specific recombinase XerD n=1 Tax=Propionigenium maris DSM 9537 TaxID=1123000 RepID=A0A9W6GME3_9FUSO|nr:site-specific integrase [Propionigenium maris]GLI57759.1 hypothetical protein PM10SUCC1_32730 [Propionigenium maris DSM 9537]